MSDLNDQLRDEMHAAFYEYTGTDGSKLPHYDGEQWTDFAAGFDAARRAPAAAPAPVAASELPPLPTFMRVHIERAITEAEQTRGFGVHDGMARLNVGYLKRIYGLADAAAQLHAAAAAPIVQAEPVAVTKAGRYGMRIEWLSEEAMESTPDGTRLYLTAPTASTADAKDAAQIDLSEEEMKILRAAKRNMVDTLISRGMNYGKCGAISNRLEKFIAAIATSADEDGSKSSGVKS